MKNYPKTSFDKSSGFNKQANYKIKKISSNQFKNEHFQIMFLKLMLTLAMVIILFFEFDLGGPFGGPACRPLSI